MAQTKTSQSLTEAVLTEPIRTCIGCRQRAAAGLLVRLVADGDRVVLGAGQPGRGAWLCQNKLLSCFDQASEQRQWGRALRRQIDVKTLSVTRAAIVQSLRT